MEQRLYKIAAAHSSYIQNYHRYKMTFWNRFDYSFLSRNIMYYQKKGKFQKGTWNDVIIGCDTETSKGHEVTDEPAANHVCAWTISIRAYHQNIVTLYGRRPSEMMECLKEIRKALQGDEFSCFFHNLSYDWVFLRQFFYRDFGTPIKELNTKPHYPIMLKFDNGMIVKDSLILSQCKLEKWANDLNVHHKKAVGSWDYDLIRDQDWKFTRAELRYIENDTLALVECLDAFCISLNKNICTIPYTATGIVREEVRKRAEQHNGHAEFLRKAPTYEQYCKLRKLYHGGYSHSNRFYNSEIRSDDVTTCKDFASSYPFCLISELYPDGRFVPLDKNVDPDYILRNSSKYAFIFRATFTNIKLKDPMLPMPALQASKCEFSINMKTDNGRIKQAGLCCLYICEVDLEVISSMYKWDECICSEVEVTSKAYLPRWFTDYVYDLYAEKCRRKPLEDQDPVAYALAKMRVNSVYGLTVQACIRDNFIEVTEPGEYKITRKGDTAWFESGDYRIDYDKSEEELYEHYLKNFRSVLLYYIGCYCTAYAFRNLFLLGDCVNRYYDQDGHLAYPPHWYYSDTDSCFSDDWNEEKVKEYNENCKKKLMANGYGAVVVDGKEYWLGVAEDDTKKTYSEFVALGSKRYAGRGVKDGELHITVAGVPKSGAKCLKDDLAKFSKSFIFSGTETGKLAHFYIYSKEGIYEDVLGNEIGDSIDLEPCDYRLDAVDREEYIMTDDYFFDYFDEGDINIYDH